MRKKRFSILLAVMFCLEAVQPAFPAQLDGNGISSAGAAPGMITVSPDTDGSISENKDFEDNISENTVSEDNTSKDQISVDTLPDINVSGNTISEGTVSDDIPEEAAGAVAFAGGTGKENDPYIISTVEQLQGISGYGGTTYFELKNDITINPSLNSKTVDWGNFSFTGHLNGAGHKIKNLIVERGLADQNYGGCLFYSGNKYQSVEYGTEISNLTLENVRVSIPEGGKDNPYIALLVSMAKNIENCTVKGEVIIERQGESKGKLYLGGLCNDVENIKSSGFAAELTVSGFESVEFGGITRSLQAYDSDNYAVASECIYSGKAVFNCKGAVKAAGIVSSPRKAKILNCKYKGRMIVESGSDGSEVFGIADDAGSSQDFLVEGCETGEGSVISVNRGRAIGITGGVYNRAAVQSCIHKGRLSAGMDEKDRNSSACGIAYRVKNGTLTDCHNEGEVLGYGIACGITGEIEKTISYPVTVSGCTNEGKVENSAENSSGYAAGIAYRVNEGAELYECANYGQVSGFNSAGIVYQISRGSTVTDCSNAGTVTGVYNAAGIANGLDDIVLFSGDELNYKSVILGCFNGGEVTCTEGDYSGHASGIVNTAAGRAEIRLCYNSGHIRGEYAGGITSNLGNTYASDKSGTYRPLISMCFNLGRIEGSSFLGGIAGTLTTGDIEYCYNAGTLAVFDERRATVGGIAGYRAFTGSYDTESYVNASIKNCFNAGALEAPAENASAQFGGILGSFYLHMTEDEAKSLPSDCRQQLVIENCYNAAKAPAGDNVGAGGIFGTLSYRDMVPAKWQDDTVLSVTGCYYIDSYENFHDRNWDTGFAVGAGKKTDSQLKEKATYTDWDFTSVWTFTAGAYRYPVLRGVGVDLLRELWSGDGASKLSSYTIHVKDKETGAGIAGAVVSWKNKSAVMDRNGNARIYAGNHYISTVDVVSPLYKSWRGSVNLSSKKPYEIKLEQDIELEPPEMDINGAPRLQGKVALIKGKYTFLYDANTNLGINLKSFTKDGGAGDSAIPFMVSSDPKKREIKISFGMDYSKKLAGYEDWYDWTKDKVERARRESNGLEPPEAFKEAAVGLVRTMSIGSNEISTKVYYSGYVTLNYATGKCLVTESGAVIGITGSAGVSYSPVSTAKLVNASVSVSAGTSGSLTIKVDPVTGELTRAGSFSLSQGISGTVTVGARDLLEAGVYFDAGLMESFTHTDGKSYSAQRDMKVTMELDGGLQGALVGQGFSYSLVKADAEIWPNKNIVYDAEGLKKLVGMNHLHGTYIADAAETSAGSVVNNDAYVSGSPALTELSDKTRLAVFSEKTTGRAAGDESALYYALTKADGTFDTEKKLKGDHAVFDPVLASSGDNIYLVWLMCDKAYSEADWKENISIMYSAFDTSNKTFSDPSVLVSGRGKLPQLLRASADKDGTLTAAWLENSANDEWQEEGENTIYTVTVQNGQAGDIKAEAAGLKPVCDMDIALDNSLPQLSWSEIISDGNGTVTGSDLYTLIQGNKTKLTDGDENVRGIKYCGSTLFYTSNGMLYMKEDGKDAAQTGISVENSFLVKEGKNGIAVLFTKRGDDGKNRLMASYLKGGVFTGAVILPADEINAAYDFGAVYLEDGGLSVLALNVVSENGIYRGERKYYPSLKADDIAVQRELIYDTLSVKENGTVTFKAKVTNNTDSVIDELNLSLKCGGTQLVNKKETGLGLSPGNTGDVSIEYTMPAEVQPGDYVLSVTSDGLSETDESNNSAKAYVGYGNLVFTDYWANILNDGALTEYNNSVFIRCNLKNTGYTALNNVSWNLVMRDSEGNETILAENKNNDDKPTLQKNDTTMVYYSFKKDDLKPKSAFDRKIFYLSAGTTDPESDYGDQYATFYYEPPAPEGMTVKKGDAVLAEDTGIEMVTGQSIGLSANVTPLDAFQGVEITSSDLNVVDIDGGTLCATGEGSADVTVTTADGTISRIIPVSVNADPSGILYGISPKNTEVERGEEGEVRLTWQDVSETQDKNVSVTNVEWRSSSENICTVEKAELKDGDTAEKILGRARLKAKNEGTARIEAEITLEGGEKKKAFGIVQVTDSRVKYAEFTEKDIELGIGEKKQLSLRTVPEGAPASDFTFSSSDTDIAVVDDNGIVTAVKEGSAVITASYNKTEEGETPVTAAAAIRVTDKSLESSTLIFDANGGNDIEQSLRVQSLPYGESYTFPKAPKRAGYDFSGWNTSSDGTGTAYTGSETLVSGKEVVGTMTLYALWTPWKEGEMRVVPVPDQTFTGAAIKPEVEVYDGSRALREGVDYTVKYVNNKKAADKDAALSPGVIVTGKGNYSGSKTVRFTILPVNLASGEVTADDIYVNHNKKLQKKIPSAVYGKIKLKNGTDYDIIYKELEEGTAGAFKDEGTYTLLLTGKGNYAGTLSVNEIITKKTLLNKVKVSGIKPQTYTGGAITPVFTVKHGKKVLKKDEDYTVEWIDNKDIGTAHIIICGMGADYAGQKDVSFKIVGESIAKAKVEGIPKGVVYTGEDITCESPAWASARGGRILLNAVVKGVSRTLSENTDYRITYADNSSAGRAKIVFTGIGSFSGTLKKSFRILPYDIGKDERNLLSVSMSSAEPYMKGGACPVPEVLFDGTKLEPGRDYTVSYKNNKTVGSAGKAKIRGKGNYTGSPEYGFTVITQDIGRLRLEADDVVYVNKKGAYKPKLSVYDFNGKRLSSGKDYKDIRICDKNGTELSEDEICEAGTELTVSVSGNGAYTGSVSGNYRIVKKAVSKVTVKPQIYTGSAVIPEKSDITVKAGKDILGADDYDIISVGKNNEKGTGTVTVRGKGNYGGIKTGSFKINAKKMDFVEEIASFLKNIR